MCCNNQKEERAQVKNFLHQHKIETGTHCAQMDEKAVSEVILVSLGPISG